VVDPQTGKMNIEWYKFFSRYERIWRALILAAGGTP